MWGCVGGRGTLGEGVGGWFPSFARRRNVIQTNVAVTLSGLLYNKAPVALQPERLEAAAYWGLDEQVEHPANRHATKPHWSPGSLGLAALALTAEGCIKVMFKCHDDVSPLT